LRLGHAGTQLFFCTQPRYIEGYLGLRWDLTLGLRLSGLLFDQGRTQFL
jgi:hypothetical protein